MTGVVNLYKEKYHVYIGRAGKGKDGYFGNPHNMGFCPICNRTHDREDSLVEYEKYFFERLAKDEVFKKRIVELKDKTLGCFCAPQRCHGTIIAKYVDSL